MTLAGRLLVASPLLVEQIFRRSVIMLLHHDDQGAHGVVLNKPLGVDVERVLPGWSSHLSPPCELFQGGPVSLDSALGLAWVPGQGIGAGVRRLFGALGVVDLDAAPDLVGGSVAAMRVFAGYSGWGPGQLERELEEDSWYVVDAQAGDAFPADPPRLWSQVLRRQGGRLAWVSSFPDDPEQN